MGEIRWVAVTTGKRLELELLRTVLEDAGIPARVPEEPERYFGNPYDGSNLWSLPLQVHEMDAERARHLLRLPHANPMRNAPRGT